MQSMGDINLRVQVQIYRGALAQSSFYTRESRVEGDSIYARDIDTRHRI